MSIFRRRRGHPFGDLAAIVAQFFFFMDDAEQDKIYTDDTLKDPLVYQDE